MQLLRLTNKFYKETLRIHQTVNLDTMDEHNKVKLSQFQGFLSIIEVEAHFLEKFFIAEPSLEQLVINLQLSFYLFYLQTVRNSKLS